MVQSTSTSANAPTTWGEFLDGQTFIINLERKPERLEKSMKRIKEAGFTNIKRFPAIDGRSANAIDTMAQLWKTEHGNPQFEPTDGKFNDPINHPHHQAIMLSHLAVLKEIINNRIPWSIVFEDDVVFHRNWELLAPKYFEITPPNYDMLYMGHHCGCGFDAHVARIPVYCLQAYGITLAGAEILYNKIINEPRGVRTIDCMLWDYMCEALQKPIQPPDETENAPPPRPEGYINWYAWNGEQFLDKTAKKNPEYAHKDQGLVFQEYDGDKYDEK